MSPKESSLAIDELKDFLDYEYNEFDNFEGNHPKLKVLVNKRSQKQTKVVKVCGTITVSF